MYTIEPNGFFNSDTKGTANGFLRNGFKNSKINFSLNNHCPLCTNPLGVPANFVSKDNPPTNSLNNAKNVYIQKKRRREQM